MLNLFYPNDYYNGGHYTPSSLKRAQLEHQQEMRRRSHEKALRQRLHQEELEERRRLEEASQLRNQERESDDDSLTYRIVRGNDGFLYRIPVQRRQKPRRRNVFSEPQPPVPSPSRIVRGPDGQLYRLMDEEKKATDAKFLSKDYSRNESFRDEHPYVATELEEVSKQRTRRQPLSEVIPVAVKPTTKSRRKFTVIVEDASDSENEDESMSYWRNRRPSPGEWMEPVEGTLR